MSNESKAELKMKYLEVRNRFALLTVHSKQALTVLAAMREALQTLRAENATLLEENARLKEAMSLVAPSTPSELIFVENEDNKEGRIVVANTGAASINVADEASCDPGTCDFASTNDGGSKCVNCGATVPF